MWWWQLHSARTAETAILGNTQMIEFTDVGAITAPQVAFDSSGNALAVWSQTGPLGAYTNIMTSRYIAASGWDLSPQAIDNSGGHAQNPQIAVAADGSAMAIWSHYDGTRFNIQSNRYSPVTGWETSLLLETDNAGDALIPQIALDATGDAFAVWKQSDGSRYNILANHYISGTGWRAPELVEQDDTGDTSDPQIAVDQDGNALAIWIQNDGADIYDDTWTNRFE